MNGIDLARFDFDYDNTWQAFFLDADLNVYGRYGGREPSSPEARLSKESLLQTMQEVLEAHERRQRAPGPEGDQEIHPPPLQPKRPTDIPLLKQHHNGCLHCHQVQEYRLLQAHVDGAFTRKLAFPFPLPENLGIRFDRSHGHRIAEVLPDSPAARAGLNPGDVVVRAGQTPIRSEDDFRWTLHHQSDSGEFPLRVRRSPDDPPLEKVIPLPRNWRLGDISWRKSLRSYPIAWGFLGYSLGSEERKTAGFPAESLAIKVVSLRGQTGGVAKALGLQKGDIILSLDGDAGHRTLEQFKSELLRRYVPGDPMRIVVRRGTAEQELTGEFPAWFTTDRTVP